MKKIILAALITLFSSGYFYLSSQPDGRLHVYFLNVGQGDAILIRTPGGQNILVDGGPKNNILYELKNTLPAWDSLLDYVILTHPDRDHIEGLISVLKRYPVKHVLATGTYKKDYFSRRFFELIREKNIPLTIAHASSDLQFEPEVFLDVIFPFLQVIEFSEKTNDSSLISKLIYGKNEILLTGDSEAATEQKLLAEGVALNADVLKVGHHGSKTSTSEDFLRAVNPAYAVISVGKDNSYHHPHPSVIKKLKQCDREILRTDRDGRIEMVFSQTKLLQIKTQGNRVISAPSRRNFSSNCS